MKKSQGPYIYLMSNINGKLKKLIFPASMIRRILEEQKGEDVVNINFFLGKEMMTIPIGRSDLEAVLLETGKAPIVPNYLSKYLVDITWALANKEKHKLIGREHEIEKAWSCLARDSRCNVFFVGDAGVGKNAITIEMARRIAKAEAPNDFLGYRIIKFKAKDFLKLEGGFSFNHLFKKIKEFIINSSDQVILYVENIIYMKYNESLMFFLYEMINKFNIKIIGTASPEHYEEFFASDFEISKYLNKIDVREPELKDIYPMIETDIRILKEKYGIDISDEVVKFIIYTSGLSEIQSALPGNVISIFKWSFSNAKRKGKTQVEKEDVLDCYNTNVKLFENSDPKEKKRIAYHEIGHYVMHRLCENVKNEEVAFVSILPMMDFLGVNWTYYTTGKQLNYSRKAYEDMIKMYLGGRASEELFSGEYADGASADLEVANNIAESMITKFGLSSKEKQANRSYTYSGYYLKDYLFSDALREELNDEIKSTIDNAYAEVKKKVEENKDLIDVLVEALLKHEILTGEELEEICKNFEKKKNKTTRRTTKTK